MAKSGCRWKCPDQWSEWSEWLAVGLHARNRWRLPVLLVGLLFAQGRRTVPSWLRAAGVSDDFQSYYYFLKLKTLSRFKQDHFLEFLCGSSISRAGFHAVDHVVPDLAS